MGGTTHAATAAPTTRPSENTATATAIRTAQLSSPSLSAATECSKPPPEEANGDNCGRCTVKPVACFPCRNNVGVRGISLPGNRPCMNLGRAACAPGRRGGPGPSREPPVKSRGNGHVADTYCSDKPADYH